MSTLGLTGGVAQRTPPAPPPDAQANSSPVGASSALRQSLEVLFGRLSDLSGERAQLEDAMLSLGFLGDALPPPAEPTEKIVNSQYPLLAILSEVANQVRLETAALRILRGRLPL